MWWIVGIVVLFIFIYLEDILKVLKNKDPLVQEEKIKKQKLEVAERYELISNLKKNIGHTCTIKSSELLYVNEKLEITGKLFDFSITGKKGQLI
ncbi:MAG TPA: hypothetical protein GXZ90_10695 [Clostridiales bacterium]|nr:hypothetical protein [Clostridiales bacterium]